MIKVKDEEWLSIEESIKHIMKSLNCSRKRAKKLLDELMEDEKVRILRLDS